MVSMECEARVFMVGNSEIAYVCRRKAGNHILHAARVPVEIVERDRIERPIEALVTWTDEKYVKNQEAS